MTTAACTETQQQLPAPVQSLQERGIQIVGTFDAPGDLTGYAGLMGRRPVAIYLTKDGQHAIVGSMVNAQGKLVNRDTLQQMVAPSLAQRTQAGLPDATLATLDGGTVQLAQVSDEPMVVNLWATWCPPCRREMPMLAAAQERHPGITFVFANQRQGPAAIRDYLQDENLQLNHVLIDAHGAIAQSVGSRGLPTTLFYDAEGNLVDTHLGMLTSASLAATLQQNGLVNTAGNNLNPTETTNDD